MGDFVSRLGQRSDIATLDALVPETSMVLTQLQLIPSVHC